MSKKEIETYYVSIEDMYRIPAKSEEEAKEILQERIGTEGFGVFDPKVIEKKE